MLNKFFIVAGSIFSVSVFAQSEKFEGASVGINAGYNTETSEIGTSTYAMGTTNPTVNINAIYTFASRSNWTLGVGVSADLTSTNVMPSAFTSGKVLSIKSHYSVNLEPGYVFNQNFLSYIKLSWNAAKYDYNSGYATESIAGVGYGFGTRYFIDKNTYLNIDVQKITYNSFVNTHISNSSYDITHQTTQATIGLGYKF